MKKVIRDERGYPLGWTDTKDRKGTYNEFCDKAGYSCRGYVCETLQSCDHGERQEIKDCGELS